MTRASIATVSMTDVVLIGACLSQPRVTQYPGMKSATSTMSVIHLGCFIPWTSGT